VNLGLDGEFGGEEGNGVLHVAYTLGVEGSQTAEAGTGDMGDTLAKQALGHHGAVASLDVDLLVGKAGTFDLDVVARGSGTSSNAPAGLNSGGGAHLSAGEGGRSEG